MGLVKTGVSGNIKNVPPRSTWFSQQPRYILRVGSHGKVLCFLMTRRPLLFPISQLLCYQTITIASPIVRQRRELASVNAVKFMVITNSAGPNVSYGRRTITGSLVLGSTSETKSEGWLYRIGWRSMDPLTKKGRVSKPMVDVTMTRRCWILTLILRSASRRPNDS